MAKSMTYLLTNEEREVVRRVAHITRCDETWFSLASDVGKGKSGLTDEVYDMEGRYCVSLRFGLNLLNDSFTASDDNREELSEAEQKVWDALIEKLNAKEAA